MNSVSKTAKLGKKIFFICFVLLLLKLLLDNSTFIKYYDVESIANKIVIRLIVYSLLFFKLITQDKISLKLLSIYILFFCLVGLMILFNGKENILDIGVFIICANGIEIKQITKAFYKTLSIGVLIIVICSLTGIIENYATYRYGSEVARYTFGMLSPTDFGAIVFYIELAFIYTKQEKFSWLNGLVFIAICVFIYVFCNARLDCILIAFTTLVTLIYTKFSFFKRHCLLIIQLLLIFIPIIVVVTIIINIIYTPNNSFLSWLNNILSNRLYYANLGIKKYGFSLFGKDIITQGWGYNPNGFDWQFGYFYIDCGFLYVSLQYGIIYFLLVFIALYIFSFSEYKTKRYLNVIIIFILFISNIVDQHIAQFLYNPFIFTIGLLFIKFANVKFNVKQTNLFITKKGSAY